jgi:hypothetical protein
MTSADPTSALARLIRFITRDRIYLRSYPAVVEKQHEDDTLDLSPDDPRIRGTGLSHIPIRHGLPGVTVRVPQGARVLLWFAEGDPTKPYASLWDPGAIESISFNGGTSPIAREGDSVTVYWPPAVAFTGTLSGSPFVGTMTIVNPSVGLIDRGASRVKA